MKVRNIIVTRKSLFWKWDSLLFTCFLHFKVIETQKSRRFMCLSFSFKLSCPRLLILWMSSVLDLLHFFILQVFSPNVCHPHLLVLQMQLSYPYHLVVYNYLWLLIILAFLFYDYWMFQILLAFLFCDCLVLQIIFVFLFCNYLLFLVVVHGSI